MAGDGIHVICVMGMVGVNALSAAVMDTLLEETGKRKHVKTVAVRRVSTVDIVTGDIVRALHATVLGNKDTFRE